MRRICVWAVVLGLGALSMAVSAQAPPGPSAAAIKAMAIQKVEENLYVITGSSAEDMAAFSGGNVAVFVGETGVTLVDSKLPGFGPTILERIRTVTDKPVVRIINTHTHGDHVGGNAFFGPTVEGVVHENAAQTMAKQPEFAGANAASLPKRTYKDRLTVGSGRDQIDLYHFGRGHTNGDTFIVFPALRTVHTGDMFAWKALPYIDTAAGGSVVDHPATLMRAAETFKDLDTVIAGHIPVTNPAALREYAEFSQDFVRQVEAARKAGKSVDQAAAEYRVPERFKGYRPVLLEGMSVGANVKIAYDELSRR